jgi:Carboxypeptidase regulatory-like domain/TonB dependent receptor
MNRLPHLFCTPIATVCLVIFAAPLSHAQSKSSLHGQVTDPSGAIVPGASVQLSGGGKNYSATSGGDGSYSFGTLPSGSYTLDVSVPGFTPFSESNVSVVNGTSRMLNIPLTIATQEQQVEVTADTRQLDTEPADNANAVVLSGKDLDALSDDPDEMQNELTALAGPAAGNGGAQIYIDGFTGGDLPPKSSIREIRINQNPFSAEFDKLGYGRIEILTKPGSDKLHGYVQASGNDSAWNTSHFVTSTPPYHQFFLNGSVGGPISKKASYFFSIFARNTQNILIVNAPGTPSDPNYLAEHGYNFVQNLDNPETRLHLTPRIDYQLTPSNTISIRYQYNRGVDTGSGPGQLALGSQASNTHSTESSIQISDSQVFNAHLVNDTRFEYERDRDDQLPADTSPTLTVQGAFTGGGSNDGTSHTNTDYFELQNYSTASYRNHSVRFGVRLRANREADYSNAGTNGNYNFDSTADFTAGKPSQGSVTKINNFNALATLFDAALFYQDDWKVNRKLTLDYGLRFETQNRIHDHADWGPRFGLAYALDGGKKRPPKTVIRAGYGWFFNRFSDSSVIQAIHQNGINQQQIIYSNPVYTPGKPPSGSGTVSPRSAAYSISPNTKAALDMQGAVGVDRTIAKTITANVTYLYSRGIHQFLTDNINAPLYDYTTYSFILDPAGNKEYPFPGKGNLYQFQSNGIYKQSQVITSINARARNYSISGFYVLSYFKSDTTGANYFPSRQDDIAFDYGRSNKDVRNRFFLLATTNLPYGVQGSIFTIANGGAPYNITTGQDLNGDNQYNERPSLVNASFCTPNSKQYFPTRYGCLNITPKPGETIVPYGSGRGPANFSANVRLSKNFAIGPKLAGHGGGGDGGPHGGGGGEHGGAGPRGGLGPGGLSGSGGGGFFGGPHSHEVRRKYNLNFTLSGNNVFNVVNLAQPNNVVSSTGSFDKSLALAGGFFNRNQTSVRTIDLQMSFSF